MLNYSHQDFSYASEDVLYEEGLGDQEERRKKDYSRGRSYRAARRRKGKKPADVGCGIAARRSKRLSW